MYIVLLIQKIVCSQSVTLINVSSANYSHDHICIEFGQAWVQSYAIHYRK